MKKMSIVEELTLDDVCQYKAISKLTEATKAKMLEAPTALHQHLNEALMESYNTNLPGASRRLQEAGFTSEQAVEVLYKTQGHREAKNGEIERAVDLVFSGEPGKPIKKSDWPVFEASSDDVLNNIEIAGIEPMSEGDLLAELGDAPEIDNASDFLAEFFKGVERPVYIGTRYTGAIEYNTNWLIMPDAIDDDCYDQVLANPMRRKLTSDERNETIVVNGKRKLKHASGGRELMFANESLDVITLECDKLPAELQFGVIRYVARHLPLVAIVDAANKSYHATYSTKGIDNIHALRRRLVDLGGDGSVMSPYQLTRLGAVKRSDKGNKLQRVLWINGDARSQDVDNEKLIELLQSDDSEQLPSITKENTYCKDGKYYILDASGERYISMNGEALTRQLRLLNYSARGAEGEMSAVDKFKAYVELHNAVDACGALAGRSIGYKPNEASSMKYLVTRKNKRVDAREGSWDNIRSILEKQYGDEQLRYFYSWLYRARYQLNNEKYNAGHALVISGAVGGGKSLIINQVIQPMLGGVADAERAMCKDNQFNSDLIGAELLLIDDVKLSRKMEDRKTFGTKIKGLTASSGSVSCHPKGVDAFTLNPLWRLVIAINDTEDDLGAMPPLGEGDEDTIGDKIIMLKCFKHELPFVGHIDQYDKIEAMIASEIEAFAYFIDHYTIPDAIKQGDSRFGFDEFHHPELLDVLNQNSNERTLLSVTTSVLFNDEYRMDIVQEAGTGRQYWQGSAQQWSTALLNSKDISHRVKGTIEGMLAYGDSAVKAGQRMKAMAEISNGRVVKGRTKKGVIWTIWDDKEPQEIIENNDNNPF